MIDTQSLYIKIKKGFIKNYREYFALKHKLYPQFVFDNNLKTLKDEIPVFTLHSVNSERFEAQLQFLKKNDYRTLTADELTDCLIGTKPIEQKSIVLTFDDGWKNLYSTAYPLLKEYNYTAVCFLIAGLIDDEESKSDRANTNLSDSKILCSWDEIREMHVRGTIDFQSHSMYHHLIYTSPKIVDYFNPKFDTYALNMDVPLVREDGKENYSRAVNFGTPIYEHSSRFSGLKRYFDDENLRLKCIEYVKINGGKNFFKNFNWRKKLRDIANNYYKMQNHYPGFYETESELRESIFNELRDSKLKIEQKLDGKIVNHFCYPWWEGSELASAISREAGYLSNFWGVLPKRRTNRKGDDPYKISRILSDDYIFRLPGNGRKSHLKIIGEKLLQNKNAFKMDLR